MIAVRVEMLVTRWQEDKTQEERRMQGAIVSTGIVWEGRIFSRGGGGIEPPC